MTDAIYTVEMTDGAESDLAAIRDYLAEHRSSETAYNLLDTLLDRIDTLEHFPSRGSIVAESAEVGNRDIRQVLLSPYRLIYHIAENGVTIIAVVDGRRDVQRFLRQRLLER